MSTRKNIGGQLNANAYELLARKHRPTDQASIANEAVRLATELGLTTTDIACCLQLSVTAVEALLKPHPITPTDTPSTSNTKVMQ